MKDIFGRYLIKINKSKNDVFFLYNGNKIKEELKLEEINKEDNEIRILVRDILDMNIKNEEDLKQFKDIICPKCGNICLINFKNYIIKLNNCKNNHSIDNILFDEFNNLQKINELCNICNKSKEVIHDNKLYKCCNCKLNLCPICKLKHNKEHKEHKLINYELNNYLCNIHDERYILYCSQCHLNLCDICEQEHDKNHDFVYLNKLIPNKENNINKLRSKIDNLKNEIKGIINKLQKIMDNMEIYYNINNNIINNYDKKYKNYEKLINIKNIDNYNKIIIKDIDEIINENKIENKIKNLYNIYDKMITKDKCFQEKKAINSNIVYQKKEKSNDNSKKNDYEKTDINNTANYININVNDNINNVINTNTNANTINNTINNYNQAPQNTGSSGKIVVVSGSGPGIPPPPPPPPPPPVVPVVPVQKAANANKATKKEDDNEEKPEPKKELSMAEQLAKVTLKKVPDAKEKKPKPKMSGMDLLRQQILLRHKQITLHLKDQEEDNEEDEDDDNN